MLRIPLKNESHLTVSSQWDSGTHCGFHALIVEDDNYNSQTLDKVLTKSQILELEALLICRIRMMLNKEETFQDVLDNANAETDVHIQVAVQETVEKFKNIKK